MAKFKQTKALNHHIIRVYIIRILWVYTRLLIISWSYGNLILLNWKWTIFRNFIDRLTFFLHLYNDTLKCIKNMNFLVSWKSLAVTDKIVIFLTFHCYFIWVVPHFRHLYFIHDVWKNLWKSEKYYTSCRIRIWHV